MSKKVIENNITRIVSSSLPTYMQQDGCGSLDALKEFVIPPRIKVVQKQASSQLLLTFSPGDVILSPTLAIVAEMPRNEKGRPMEGATAEFKVVPVFFYPEWVTWNPLEMQGQVPAIEYRTTDPTDPIVAKSRNSSLRCEPYPSDKTGKMFRRHVEHLNFIVMLYEHSLSDTAVVLTFSRGEHISGTKFASLLRLRNAPIFGGVYKAVVNKRTRNGNDWYGIDMMNPDDDPWVKQDEYDRLKALNAEFIKLHKEARLRAQLDDKDGVPDDDVATTPTKEF